MVPYGNDDWNDSALRNPEQCVIVRPFSEQKSLCDASKWIFKQTFKFLDKQNLIFFRCYNGEEAMMAKYFYPAIFERDTETGTYTVTVCDLSGCVTQGNTVGEAVEMAQKAVGVWLEGKKESDFPAASDPWTIKPSAGQFILMIDFDKTAYDKKYNSRAVKKTLSIPEWLDTMAKEKNLNFSGILQEALKLKLGV